MIEHFIVKYHLLPFEISFFIGFVLIVWAPISYRKREKKKYFLSPMDLLRYNKFEKIGLILGIIFFLVGIIGIAKMDDKYGHEVKVTDEYGNSTIVKEKW